MPGAVRVILEPIPSAEGSLQEVTQAKVKLANRGPGSTLATTAPRPAELAFTLVAIKGIRLGAESAAQPVATLRGQLRLEPVTEQPLFDTTGNDLVTTVPLTDEPDQNRLALELDAESFGAPRSFVLPLPSQTDDVDKLELRVELKIGGATESAPDKNDFFDGFFKKVEIIEPKIVSLGFASDHQVLLDNDFDLTGKGDPIGQPEWKFGLNSRAILHTKNSKVDVRIELQIFPLNADPVDCVIEGKSKDGLPPLTFKLNQRLQGGLEQFFNLTSAETLPDELTKLSGKIEWSVTVPKKGKLAAGDSFGHIIYLTLGKPEDPPGQEAGITRRRVERSQELVRDTGTSDPHQVIKLLMTNVFPAYTLEKNPNVPKSLNHPAYFNEVGGAWRILEHLQAAAECQAIVRVVRGIGNAVGMPGNYEAITATVDADTGLPFEDPTGKGLKNETRTFKGLTVFPFLVAEPPGPVGRIFEIGPKAPALNFFEACLRFTQGGKVKLYPGGVGGADFDDVVQVINASFVALIWVSDVPPATPDGKARARVERIVKTYP